MTRSIKLTGEVVTVLKQFRNESNNYINDDSKVYADLYKIRYNNGRVGILCQTEIEEL